MIRIAQINMPARRPSVVAMLRDWAETIRQRRALAQLAPHLLQDVGLTRSDALAEAQRPFWDAPKNWRI